MLYPFRIALLLFVAWLTGCATVYQSEDFAEYQQRHKTVAILPPAVSINAESFKTGTPIETIESQQDEESAVFHRQLYAQLLAQQKKRAYSVEFQDVEDTLARLARENVDAKTLRTMTRAEIAKMLEVDAVMSLRLYRDKPMSAGVAVFSVLMAGASVANEVQVNLSVHDGQTGRLVWNFDHLISGGLVSSAEGMARSLMKGISKKFPYETKSKS